MSAIVGVQVVNSFRNRGQSTRKCYCGILTSSYATKSETRENLLEHYIPTLKTGSYLDVRCTNEMLALSQH